MTAPPRPSDRESPVVAPRPLRGRSSRQWTRLLPLAAAAAAALAAGVVVGARSEDPRRTVAEAFVRAWSRGDYAAMHATITEADRRDIPLRRFSRAYRAAARVATLAGVRGGRAAEPGPGGVVPVPLILGTRAFGTVEGRIGLPVTDSGEGPRVDWARHLVFPGLRPGEKLGRRMRMPARGTLEARDGTPLAAGNGRTSELGAIGADVAGSIGPAPPERTAELARRGVPPDTPVGLSGLEREFDRELSGTPGGQLRAGRRVLASVTPRPGADVRTTIDARVQAAAVAALAGRLGGVAVLRPGTGEVLALAGLAYSAPQPPGSVFKIITLAGALEAGVVRRRESFPVRTAATLEGVELENANGESCGGSLRESFAHSCNSVFAPLGAELGAGRLVAAAEAFGFNEDPGMLGALPSTIPPPDEIGDDLAVGSTAIGQGRLLATPLHFAAVAAAIATGGVRTRPTLLPGAPPRRERVAPAPVARTIGSFMRSVVTDGTGTAAAIPGVRVAGKTGTAELRDTTVPEAGAAEGAAPVPDATDTNAWFAAYAPARRPRVAVAVMLVGQGAGGATAAPAARMVMEAALAGRD